MKRIICVLIAACFVCLSGCFFSKTDTTENEMSFIENTYCTIFETMENGDTDAIYALFSENVKNTTPDLAEQLSAFFSSLKGKVVETERFACSSHSERNDGKFESELYATERVITTENSFWVEITACIDSRLDPALRGVTALHIIAAEDYPLDAAGFTPWVHYEQIWSYGAHVITQWPKRYYTMEDFSEIVIGKSTATDVAAVLPLEGEPVKTKEGYAYNYPLTDGTNNIAIRFDQDDIVTEIKIVSH